LKLENHYIAHLVELLVAEYYTKKRKELFSVVVGNCSPFDLEGRSSSVHVEVKFESNTLTTYNLCIEHSSWGRPSGIAATKADLWVHCVPMPTTDENTTPVCCFEFSVPVLRRSVADRREVLGGESRRSAFRLLPLKDAEQIVQSKFTVMINWNELQPYWEKA